MSNSRRVSSRTAHTPGSLRDAESSEEEEDKSEDEGGHGGGERQQRAVRPAKKEPKAPLTPDTLAPIAPGTAVPAAPRRKKTAAAVEDPSLLELLVKHPEEAGNAAKAWVFRYFEDQTLATAELLTLLVQAAGVSHIVSHDEVEEGDADELASRLRAMVMEDGGFEPFSNKRTARGMRAGFPAFWLALIEELHGAERLVSPTTGNTDDFALEKLKDLAVALSLQVVRPFRLAATLCAAQLVSSMVGVRKQLQEALAQVIQQRDAEQKKGGRANKATLTSLQRQVDSYHRRDDSINAWVDSLIKSVFAVRFRDVAPSIRALVISSFGQWIMIGPASFLSDAYLKYLGWALSDRDASVRFAAISALKGLYTNPANVAGMRDFKGRFLGRMMELPYDVSDAVAAAGMELLATLVQLQEVEYSQMRDVYGLLADESAFIREAAATLAARMLRAEAGEREKAETTPKAGKGGKSNAKKGAKTAGVQPKDAHATDVAVLLEVMAWMRTGSPSSQGAPATPLSLQAVTLLVDSLYDSFPAIRDGSALAGLLADESLAGDSVHGTLHAAHAAMLLAASLQRAQRGSVAGSGAGKAARPRSKTSAPNSSVHQDTSLALIGSLPSLIRKYQTQGAVVAPLCHAVRLLQLELFALRNEERAYGDLLNLVSDQVFRHADYQVATQAVDTLVFCSKAGPGSLQPIARLALSSVVAKASQGLGAAARAVLKLSDRALQAEVEELESAGVGGTAPEGAAALWRLKVSLIRVQALLARGAWSVSSNANSVWDCLSQLLDRCGAAHGQGLMGMEVTGQVVHAAHASLLAGLAQLKQAHEDGCNAEGEAPKAAATSELVPAPVQAVSTGSKRVASTGRGRKGAKRARGGRRGVPADEADAEEELEEEQGGDKERVIEGGGTGGDAVSAGLLSARADALAQKLMFVFDAAQNVPIIRVIVNRAMTDLLLLFGHNTWKGTPLEGCRLDVDTTLLNCCWLGCDTALRLPQNAMLSADLMDSQDADFTEQDERLQANAHIRALQRRLLAVGGIARLLLSPSLLPEHKDHLAVRLLSQFTSYGPEVEEMVRDIAVELRRRKHQGIEQQQQQQQQGDGAEGMCGGLTMAELNVEALKHSYEGVLGLLDQAREGREHEEEEALDLEQLAQALHAFNETASALSSLYAGVGLSRDELVSLVRGGARFALAADSNDRGAAVPRMYFLSWGLEPFIPKLLPQDAAQLVGELEGLAEDVAAAPGVPPMRPQANSKSEEEDAADEEATSPEWMQYEHFMAELKDRASKAKAGKGQGRGALKGGRARVAASPSPPNRLPSLDSPNTEPQHQQEETDAQRQRQQPATFGRHRGNQHAQPQAPPAPHPRIPPAHDNEEPFDTLLDGSAPLSEDAQLPRIRQSQLQRLRGRQEAMSRGAHAHEQQEEGREEQEEGEEEEEEGVEEEGDGGEGQEPSQTGTQTGTQTTSEPPLRALRRRRV
uniref:SCD domain-containing protein n=1 Tax=Dunaliella tertiolecta TaxID=3047 RepID=A0A7S3VIM3_DUNTE|mmetsp:Transcript_7541/g.20082  ORF Transcript_7541/g.20082 Transcript_7541/m.20082 type:complete len:1466 (-) Transcript_7541:607-5004(-)